VTADFMVSIWIEVGENERQLLAFMELNGSEICDMIGRLYGGLYIYILWYPNKHSRQKYR
jgi:hypothetical protein